MSNTVTTYYLEMTSPGELRPSANPAESCEVRRAEIPCPELNLALYQAVGRDWHWRDRLAWSQEEWRRYVHRPEFQTWLGFVSGTPFGYFELERQAGKDVEIRIFGLLPSFLGQGLGGYLLTEAIRRAWDMDARRVWVHTCTLDHPVALANYKARGLRLYDEQVSSSPGTSDPP
jgi:GNAT superfamily N-acetyltransferase